MKVFVIPGKHPLRDGGGYGPYARSVAQCLTAAGHEAHILAFSGASGIEKTDFGTIHTVDGWKNLETEGLWYWCRRFAEHIDKLLAPGEECVIHGIGAWAYVGSILRRRYKRRVTLLASYFTTADHEVGWLRKSADPKDYGWRTWSKFAAAHAFTKVALVPFERQAIEDCDRIIVHYESTKQQIQAEFSTPDSRFVKCAYYVEVYAKDNHGKTAEAGQYPKPLVVSVCRQEPRKGIHHLLRALAILDRRGVQFHAVLAGSGGFLEANRRIASRLGLDGKVELPGFVRDLNPLLSAADVFVLSSLQEGSGAITVLEAMAAGLPVVSTTCDGMPEDVEHEVNGLLVPPADATAMADAIQRMLADPVLRKRASAAARKTIDRFAFAHMQRDIARIYASLGAPSLPAA